MQDYVNIRDVFYQQQWNVCNILSCIIFLVRLFSIHNLPTGPSCRALFFEFGETRPEKFMCKNYKCGEITHKDLEKVFDKENPDKIDKMGYRCRKCKKQQRRAHLERYWQDEEYLNNIADAGIARVEHEFKSNLNVDDLDLKEDRERIKDLFKYVNNPNEDRTIFFNTLKEFAPLFAKIIKNSPGFQKAIQDDKDEIIEVVLDMFNAPNWTKELVNSRTLETVSNVLQIVEGDEIDAGEVIQNVANVLGKFRWG